MRVKKLLFPPVAVRLVLIPVSVGFLVYSMVTESVVSPVSYALAAYTLTVWCCQIPRLIRFFKGVTDKSKYAQIWLHDTHLRMKVSLYGSLIWNTAYAAFQLGLGVWHHTFWFYSMAGYYMSLAVMRLFLARHISRHKPGEQMAAELRRYRACGIVFLLMNLALSLVLFFMIYWNRTFHHHEITTIAMAAYTFGSLTMAIVNAVKYRRYQSPVYSASKAISLAAACVSMLTLESTMLTTFGDASMDLTARRIMLGASGGAVSVFIIVMAVYMIVQSSKKLKTTEGQTDE